MSAHRLVLGTAAIGLDDYGCANVTGKPSIAEVEALFDMAAQGGIRWVDTAQAYGNAEALIGDLGASSQFRVCTKLHPDTYRDPQVTFEGATARALEQSVKRLKATPDCVLIHDAEVVRNPPAVMAAMSVCARWGIPLRGVSCYTPEQAALAISAGATAIQVPLNLLDLRAMTVFAHAERRGVTVFCRAPFLQGLLANERARVPLGISRAPLSLRLYHWFQRCKAHGVRPALAALRGALEAAGEHRVVFGCETIEQLSENLGVDAVAGGVFEAMRTVLSGLDDAAVNPSLWAKETT